MDDLTARRRWRLIAWGLFRAAATVAVMVALFYVLPLGYRSQAEVVLELGIGVALLAGMIAWQVRAIIRSAYPGIRAAQALAASTALFLLLFASAYYVMALENPARFTERLSRSDALYLTITVFSTVGFGDISARGVPARLVVAAQMLLDLLILGLGVQLMLGAVQRSRTPQEPGRIGT